ncbi:hypothetical protein BD779DRAFT_902646 [Infundibulicybe gibba]|nr:hypothetical protein BD779DRAFT_902646 [Infundibulicybe gibba]
MCGAKTCHPHHQNLLDNGHTPRFTFENHIIPKSWVLQDLRWGKGLKKDPSRQAINPTNVEEPGLGPESEPDKANRRLEGQGDTSRGEGPNSQINNATGGWEETPRTVGGTGDNPGQRETPPDEPHPRKRKRIINGTITVLVYSCMGALSVLGGGC